MTEVSDVGGSTSQYIIATSIDTAELVDAAVQLFGGTGVVAGATVERLYREIRALRIYEGTSEIHRIIIARSLLAEAG